MDKLFKDRYKAKSTRLANWDYGSNGKYFVTICTQDKKHFFGNIKSGSIVLSEIGEYTQKYWEEIPEHHSFVELDSFIIMPNHIHGIIKIGKKGHSDWSPNKFGPQTKNLGAVIRDFKAAVTRHARKESIDFQWQARFHDRIIRNDPELDQIRDYIKTNPTRWENSTSS